MFLCFGINIKKTISMFLFSDGAKLEYIHLEFSHSEYIATITGVPEYKLIIW